jgi:hypothetical protein
VLKDRIVQIVLPVTVNPIDNIVPCSEGQDSAVCFAGYCQLYQYNCNVWRRAGFTCMFCFLLSILSIQLYRVLKGRFQMDVLLVTVNTINTIVPFAERKVSAGYSAGYCQSYQ